MPGTPLSKSLEAKTVPALLLQWSLETVAFVLAPILVYFVAYSVLSEPIAELFRLREWLLIAILLLGADIRINMVRFRMDRGFATRVVRHVALGLLGILIASILLCFSILAERKPDLLTLPPSFYAVQFVVVAYALCSSAINAILKGTRKPNAIEQAMRLQEEFGATPDLADYHVNQSVESALQ